MISDNLLKKIGYSPEMQDDYRKIKAIADEKIALYAKDYFFEKILTRKQDVKEHTMQA